MVLEVGLELAASPRLPSDATNHPACLTELAAGTLLSTVAAAAVGSRPKP